MLIFVAVFLVIFIPFLWYRNKCRFFAKKGIPSPPPVFPFGNIKLSVLKQRNFAYDLDDIYRGYKGKSLIVGVFMKFTPVYLATEADFIKRMCIKDFKTFKNNDFQVDPKKDPIISRNPFWLRDEAWKAKRAELAPAFAPLRLKALYPVVLESTKKLVEYIRENIEDNPEKAFDARDLCSRYTCDSVSSSIWGTDAKSFESEEPFLYKTAKEFLRGLLFFNQSLFFPGTMMSQNVKNFFVEMTRDSIRYRKDNNIEREDILAQIMSVMEKNGSNDLDNAGHAATVFLDGYETTALTLHRTFYELGRDQRVQAKLRAEIRENLSENGFLDQTTLLELPYLDQIFNEVLRLHPPIIVTSRVNSEEFKVEGENGQEVKIESGSTILIPIRSIHRDPEYFAQPDVFNPERFDSEHGGVKAFKDRCVLIPFGDGPRICIGMKFAYMQLKTAIAEVVHNFEIAVDQKTSSDLTIGPCEFMNIPANKIYLNFRSETSN